MNKFPETPPPSAAFSFKVKSLLLEMLDRTEKMDFYLNRLVQGNKVLTEGTEDTLADLKTEAKKFYTISRLNLLTLSWLAASRELTDRDALAVRDIKERVKNLAGRAQKEPLRDWQEAETAFWYIRKVELNLEAIKIRMLEEEEAALEKERRRDEENNQKRYKRVLWAIAASILSALLGSLLG